MCGMAGSWRPGRTTTTSTQPTSSGHRSDRAVLAVSSVRGPCPAPNDRESDCDGRPRSWGPLSLAERAAHLGSGLACEPARRHAVAATNCQSSVMPLRLWVPRSVKPLPDPVVRSFTVLDTSPCVPKPQLTAHVRVCAPPARSAATHAHRYPALPGRDRKRLSAAKTQLAQVPGEPKEATGRSWCLLPGSPRRVGRTVPSGCAEPARGNRGVR
jgi:hypothetical protein